MEMKDLESNKIAPVLAGDISLTRKNIDEALVLVSIPPEVAAGCFYGVEIESVIILKLELPERSHLAFVGTSRSFSTDTDGLNTK